jgi:glutamate-1-semialdehyde 2,1-aminomutase
LDKQSCNGATPLSKSELLFERACKVMPGGVHSNARYLKPFPLYFSKADGKRIWDVDGNEYVDYFVNHGAIVLGHAYPQVEEAVRMQMESGLAAGYESELTVSAAEDLVQIIPHAEMARFAVSGSDAVASAIQIARGYTGRKKILKTEGAWHGTYDYVCASYRPPSDKAGPRKTPRTIPESAGFVKEDVIKNTLVVPFNDSDTMAKVVKKNRKKLAATIIEPIMHNCGAIMPKEGYLQSVREIAEDNDMLLILDEVITGFRGAPGGAQEYYSVEADIATYGKAIANGYPIAAIVGKKDILQVSGPDTRRGSIGGFGGVIFAGTFHAHHLSVAACKATMAALKDGKVAKHLNRLTDKLKKSVEDNARDLHSNIRVDGLGGEFTFYFSDREVTNYREAISSDSGTGAKFLKLQKHLQDRGIRFLPRHIYHHGFSYSHAENDIEELVLAIRESLRV